jgi:hypothetical protein
MTSKLRVHSELLLLPLLKIRHYKVILAALTVFSALLFSPGGAIASGAAPSPHISYRTQLNQDLDGDHKPETATIRQTGLQYRVSVHFTTGRPKVHLTTYIRQGIAGLSFEARDVNNDSKEDLIITSATSVRPIAVWLNKGHAKFQKTHASFVDALGRYTGPAYRVQAKTAPAPASNLSIDPLPQAAVALTYLTLQPEASALVLSHRDQRRFHAFLVQEPPRGPPAPALV